MTTRTKRKTRKPAKAIKTPDPVISHQSSAITLTRGDGRPSTQPVVLVGHYEAHPAPANSYQSSAITLTRPGGRTREVVEVDAARERILDRLNRLLELDPKAISGLYTAKQGANRALKKDPRVEPLLHDRGTFRVAGLVNLILDAAGIPRVAFREAPEGQVHCFVPWMGAPMVPDWGTPEAPVTEPQPARRPVGRPRVPVDPLTEAELQTRNRLRGYRRDGYRLSAGALTNLRDLEARYRRHLYQKANPL